MNRVTMPKPGNELVMWTYFTQRKFQRAVKGRLTWPALYVRDEFAVTTFAVSIYAESVTAYDQPKAEATIGNIRRLMFTGDSEDRYGGLLVQLATRSRKTAPATVQWCGPVSAMRTESPFMGGLIFGTVAGGSPGYPMLIPAKTHIEISAHPAQEGKSITIHKPGVTIRFALRGMRERKAKP